MVANADLAGVNPGSDTLVELLERFGPCLIIIDERSPTRATCTTRTTCPRAASTR